MGEENISRKDVLDVTNKLQDLAVAFNEVLKVFEGKVNLNELDSISEYPFHKSFDELNFDVIQWVCKTNSEIMKKYL